MIGHFAPVTSRNYIQIFYNSRFPMYNTCIAIIPKNLSFLKFGWGLVSNRALFTFDQKLANTLWVDTFCIGTILQICRYQTGVNAWIVAVVVYPLLIRDGSMARTTMRVYVVKTQSKLS